MEKVKSPSTDLSAMTEQTTQQAHEAMDNYLDFFQKNMSFAPWAGTELTKKVTDYAQQNFNSCSGFAHKLAQAKDLQDMMRIQTEFFQTQMKSFTEQAKDLTEVATKAMGGALKNPFNPSS